MDVRLNLINRSNDRNNSSVVIFQKNVSTDFNELAVAWQVIQNLGQRDSHPFIYPQQSTVGAEDSYGNFTPQFPVNPGQAYEMIKDSSGDVLRLSQSPAVSPSEFEIRNNLEEGVIYANVFKSGKLLATRTNVAPGQKAVFEFKPFILMGVVSQVEEGQVMDSAIISDIDTEFDLTELASADIIWSGGGSGPNSTPFEFTMENKVYSSPASGAADKLKDEEPSTHHDG